MSDQAFNNFLDNGSLEEAAFLEDHPSHPELALPMFIHWAKTSNQLRHQASGTWHAGPKGVHWVGALYVHFTCAFTMFEQGLDVLPTDLHCAFATINFAWLKQLLLGFGKWLEASLQESITVLQQTFPECAQAWHTAVIAMYLAHSDENIGNESVAHNTHGILQSQAGVHACYDQLQSSNLDLTFGEDNLEFAEAHQQTQWYAHDLECGLSNSDSTSVKEIHIPDFRSETDTELEPESHSQYTTILWLVATAPRKSPQSYGVT
ncbi:hypothetical protein FRC11_008867, partial [Ceratobasidium sp. 423]